MAEANKTFSESWYRVAGQHVSLRPHVQVHRQFFRGQKWYVLRDPFTNQFYRLRPVAYELVARLRRDRTVQEVWDTCLELNPDEAPGQQEVIELLAQLFYANLIQSDNPTDSARLFERYRKRRQREIQSKLFNIMFAHFPLLDPDNFLKRTLPLVGLLITPVGALLWFLSIGAAVKIAIEHGDELLQQSQAILAPSNLFLLYVGMVLIKAIHEFGHAFVCRKLGGEVHEMGIMLLVFTPLPYVDASSSWSFRSRWHRALVGGAGILTELWVAAGAAFVWAHTAPGTLHSLAYNMMFIASVSTILFNGNPLLRYDGYYILSDLLEIPNLAQRSREHLYYFVKKYIYGVRRPRKIAHTASEARWLGVYAVASTIYRVFICVAILLFVADKAFFLGAILAALAVVTWVFVPLGKFLRYLFTSDEVARVRVRALATTGIFLAAVIIGIGAIRVPDRARAEGVIEPRRLEFVYMGADGFIDSFQPTGTQVSPDGPTLLTAHNRQLQTERQMQKARLEWLKLQY